MDCDQVIAAVKRRAFLPDDGGPFTDAELYKIGSDCFIAKLVPPITAARESFLQQYKRYAVAGTLGIFPMPPRAAGGALHIVRYVDTAGNFWPITSLDDAQRGYMPQNGAPVTWWTGWFFDGDRVRLQPPPPAGVDPAGYVEIAYQGRPNEMVSVASTCAVSSASYSGGVWTVNSVTNPTPLGIVKDAVVDVVAATGAHDWRLFSALVLSVTGGGPYTIAIAAPTDDGRDGSRANVSVGDYVCLQGQTAVPQCPDELHRLLIVEMAYYILSAQRNPNAALLAGEVLELRKDLTQAITPRADAQPKRVVSRWSPLRSRVFRGWGR